jgi:hypothetical protein
MATDLDTARHQYEMYRFCYENGHEQWLATARRCFDFFNNKQWNPQTKARLDAQRRAALTFNVIESLVRSMKGIQRALRHDVRYLPQQLTSGDDARVMDAVWLHVQQQNGLDFLETDIYEKGLIMGRAYYDVRVDFDESFQGHVKVKGRRSQDVILDPSIDTYETEDWPQVTTRRWTSSNDIAHMFGKEKARAVCGGTLPEFYDYDDQFMAQQMGNMPYYRFDGVADSKEIRAHLLLERQYYQHKMKEVFVDVATGDFSEVPESWDRNRIAKVLEQVQGVSVIKRKMKTVRWTVTCEQEVLHDEDSPYKRFTIVPFFPTFVDGTTMGAVESLLDPQELYNKITSQELHIINTTANSGYKVKAGSLKNMTEEQLEERGAQSGFVAVLEDVKDLEKIQPNSTPQGHDRLSFKADQIMRSISGVSNQARGFAREDVAGSAIESNQAAQDINFAGYLTNLHRTKRMVAVAVMDCVQSSYTEERVIQINRGSSFNPKMEAVTLNQVTPEGKVLNDVTSGKYTTVLVPAPSRTSMSEEDFNLMVKLRTEVGIMIPDELLIELSPASNKAQIIQMLQGDSTEAQRRADEAAAATAEAELAKTQAAAQKDLSAAELNTARAQKFQVEAQSDPDASYERVEQERIEMDRQQGEQKLQLEREKFQHEKEFDTKTLAIKLVEIDEKRQMAKDKAVADAKKPKPVPGKAKAKAK